MKTIREGNKIYTYNPDTGLVTEAAVVETPAAVVDVEASMERELSVGARVEADGKLGVIVARTDSVYGEAFGVRFDDGTFDEYLDSEIKQSSEEKSYDSPESEIKARFAEYNKLPAITEDEIETRTREATTLNRLARQTMANGKLTYAQQYEIDDVVTTLTSDLQDLAALRDEARLANNSQYETRFDRFEVDKHYTSAVTFGNHGDASWLEDAIDGMEVAEATEADLAIRATEVVANFDRDQLENNSFVEDAASYHVGYLSLGKEAAEQFIEYVEAARQERLASLPLDDRTAGVDEDDDLDDFDTTALYL